MTPELDVVSPESQYYIVAPSPRGTERSLVLKSDDTFAVFDAFGDIGAGMHNEEGVYHRGTRFLTKLEILLANGHPLLLSSTVRRDNTLIAVDLTNPDIY